ncbi:MAG TPA: TIM barrel protein [Rubricoccaceae bacterium]|jgi:sugar phosphate isomerase/epimerase
MLPVLATDSVTDDLARAVGYALLWGLEGVAVRTVGGERVPFVNEAALRRRLADSEMPLAAVDPGLFEGDAGRRAVWLNDVAAFDDTAAFCRRLGCRVVRVGALGASGDDDARIEALRALGHVATRSGLRLAVRNEAGTAVATGAALADLLARVDHPAVGADWRPAEALAAGEAPLDGLGALLSEPGRVTCVTVVDVQTADDGVRVDAVIGEGDLAWPEQFGRLAAAGFDGPLALDVPGRPTGASGLASGSALVRLVRGARRAAGPTGGARFGT